jgi:hypothetical protein
MLKTVPLYKPIVLALAFVSIAAPTALAKDAPTPSPQALGAIAGTTAERSLAAPPGPSPRTGVRVRASQIGSLLARLLGRAVNRGANIISSAVRRWAWRQVSRWSRWQVVHWWCSQWHRYFGYDTSRWYWAAHYYWGPRWAWNFCVSNGY